MAIWSQGRVDAFKEKRRNFHGEVNHNLIMQTNAYNVWWPRLATLCLAAIAAAQATYWALKVRTTGEAHAVVAEASSTMGPIEPQLVARALGGGQVAPTVAPSVVTAGRFVLTGVVADQSQGGAALIAVDGQAPKPFRVGSRLDDGLILQSVQPRSAQLGAALGGTPSLTLELPPLKE
jgi:general secretion pathway protein C